MASTRHKNLAGSYAQEKRELALSVDYKTNKNKFNSNKPMLPDFGIVGNNMGAGMFSNLMSNNGCDIESKLRGLGSSDLENTHRKITPSLNKMNHLAFFERPVFCAPNPLVVEQNQRPTGPFASNLN